MLLSSFFPFVWEKAQPSPRWERGKEIHGLPKKIFFSSLYIVSLLEQGRHTPACVYESPWTVEAPHGTGLSSSLRLICFLLFHCICRVCVVWRQLWEGVEINTIKSNPYIQKATNFVRRWSGFSAESHYIAAIDC